MYDIHSHILPAFDDGAVDLDTALQMAQIAVSDGVTHMACTPHIYPGLYEYDTQSIAAAIKSFSDQLKQANIPLNLAAGADIQMVPEMLKRLQNQTMPTINASRYLLFEPPHHVAPFNFVRAVLDVKSSGYVPVITHPERLAWIDEYYEQFINVAANGAWLQITAGSITGHFGKHARYWSERLLAEGLVHVIASDAHNVTGRTPILSEGVKAAATWVGEDEARAMVFDRPRAIWENLQPEDIKLPSGFDDNGNFIHRKKDGLLKRIFNNL